MWNDDICIMYSLFLVIVWFGYRIAKGAQSISSLVFTVMLSNSYIGLPAQPPLLCQLLTCLSPMITVVILINSFQLFITSPAAQNDVREP